MPIVIVIVATAMSWWSAKTESAVEQHVRDEVLELIPLIRDNPEIVNRMVVDPVLSGPVGKTLSKVSLVWSGNKKDLLVTVTTGDDPNYGDGTATHVAIVDVGEYDTVSLRILCDGKNSPMYIAGIWTP
jgi:hypothetical protein